MATGNAQTAKTKIVLNYEITEKDFVAYTMRRSKSFKFGYSLILWAIFMLIILPGCFSYMATEPTPAELEQAPATSYIALVIVVAVFCAFIVFIIRLLTSPFIWLCVKAMMKKDRIDESIGKCKLEILDNKIRETINERVSEVSYSQVRSVETDKKRIYLYWWYLSSHCPVFRF